MVFTDPPKNPLKLIILLPLILKMLCLTKKLGFVNMVTLHFLIDQITVNILELKNNLIASNLLLIILFIFQWIFLRIFNFIINLYIVRSLK